MNDYIITDDGTWEIYTADGLLAWNTYVTDTAHYVESTDIYGYKCYVVETNATLMADISLKGKSWTPVGYYDYKKYYYAGTFDGNDHTISNLTIDLPNTSSYVGLFRLVGENGMVKKLTLRDVEISGENLTIGGIAGENYGAIENCSVSGKVEGFWHIGGIAGDNYGTIENCSVSATVSVTVWGTSSAMSNNVGGIAGLNLSEITACYYTGIIKGTINVGGIAGENQRTITACYNTGDVSGASCVGGIAGADTSSNSRVTACYNTGQIIGTESVGGIVGSNSATVKACCWKESSANQGIGDAIESDPTTMVGGNGVTWETAMDEMNTVLSGYGYKYKENPDSTTNDTMPLIIVKSSN